MCLLKKVFPIFVVLPLLTSCLQWKYKQGCPIVWIIDSYPKNVKDREYEHCVGIQYLLVNESRDSLFIPCQGLMSLRFHSAFYVFNQSTGRKVSAQLMGGRTTDYNFNIVPPGDSTSIFLCLYKTDLEVLGYQNSKDTYDFVKKMHVIYRFDERDRNCRIDERTRLCRCEERDGEKINLKVPQIEFLPPVNLTIEYNVP